MGSWISKLWDIEDRSVSPGPVLGAFLVISFVALEGYDLYRSPEHHFDAQTFGIGAAAIIAAINSAGWIRPKGAPPAFTQPTITGEQ
jgi:hypothetical protein